MITYPCDHCNMDDGSPVCLQDERCPRNALPGLRSNVFNLGIKKIEYSSTQHLDLLGAPYHFNLLTGKDLADVRAFGRDCMAAERSRIASLLRQRGQQELARMVEGE